jgi:hypothetical protein
MEERRKQRKLMENTRYFSLNNNKKAISLFPPLLVHC